MIIVDGNNTMIIRQSLICEFTSAWKAETDEKNKEICNNEKVNKVQQSKNGRIN